MESRRKIKSETNTTASVNVTYVAKKIMEKRLRWYARYGHVRRREDGHILIRMSDAPVPGWEEMERKTESQAERHVEI